jgi:hypothetical protein
MRGRLLKTWLLLRVAHNPPEGRERFGQSSAVAKK